jgi:hypothetical protein
MKKLILILAAALALTSSAQTTNLVATNVTHTVTNRLAGEVTEIQVPLVLSSLRFVITNVFVMGADITADRLLLDVPGSSQKMFSYKLDPTAWYVVETKIMVESGIIQTKRFRPETGLTDMSPNLLRNRFSGEFDSYKVFLVPTPPVPPRDPGEVTTP